MNRYHNKTAAYVKVGEMIVLADRGRSAWKVTSVREPDADSIQIVATRGKQIEVRNYWRGENVEAKL
jgi:hypothetical protein